MSRRSILCWEDEKMNRKHVLWKLFVSTLYLSAFTFGGGYVIVTLMKEKFVDEAALDGRGRNAGSHRHCAICPRLQLPSTARLSWAISSRGLLGALVAIVATIIPPFVIITVISYFYELFRDNFIVSKLLPACKPAWARYCVRRVGHGRRHSQAEKRCFRFYHACGISCHMRIPRECGLYHPRLHRPRRSADGACKKEDGCMMYLQLFLSFLQIGALSFGGGYAAMR